MATRSYLGRFVHPWLAAIATTGVILWAGSFLVAVAGLAVRSSAARLAADLFVVAGLIGVFGMLVLASCGLWLVGLRARQLIGARWS